VVCISPHLQSHLSTDFISSAASGSGPESDATTSSPPTKTTIEAVRERFGIKDPLFADQWHLVNDEYPEHTLNVTSVWDIGITGKGVITSFLDDGLAFDVPDLKDAFVSPS